MGADTFVVGNTAYTLTDWTAYYLVVFVGLILVELLVQWRSRIRRIGSSSEKKSPSKSDDDTTTTESEEQQQPQQPELYRLSDSFGSLATVATQVLTTKLFTKWMKLTPYLYLYHYCAIYHTDLHTVNSLSYWSLWIFTFLGVDFLYYLFHRWSHECNLGWMAHSTHHSSEDYNFTTALRQSMMQGFFSWGFYLPLAFIVPPEMYWLHDQINLVYQFWIHTRVVPKLGFLEHIINTPSHHRVHHARNPPYIDKNYAGTLIIWDRLLGTFEREQEEPIYGLIHPIQSFNPLHVQTVNFVEAIKTTIAVPGIRRKILMWIKAPGWNPFTGGYFEIPPVDPKSVKFAPANPYPTGFNAYAFVQFVGMFLVAAAFVAQPWNRFSHHLVEAIFIFSQMSLIGLVFDADRRAIVFEFVRLVQALLVCFVFPRYFLPSEMMLEVRSRLFGGRNVKIAEMFGLFQGVSLAFFAVYSVACLLPSQHRHETKSKQQ